MRCTIEIDGFTLIELMLGMLLGTLLMTTLLMVYSSMKRRFIIVSDIINMQENGRFIISLLRHKIHHSLHIDAVYTRSAVPSRIKRSLRCLSDVLIIDTRDNNKIKKTAYYLAKTSWKYHGKPVEALFEKPLPGRRREIAFHVVGLNFHNIKLGHAVAFNVMLSKSSQLVHLSREWYGFAVLRGSMT